MKENINVYEELIRIQQSGESAALCVLTKIEGSSPQIAGAKMIVEKNGKIIGTVGGGSLEKKLSEIALEVIESNVPRSVKYHLVKDLGMACGGEAEAYLEPIEGRSHLVIFGGGHIARPMATIGRLLGFKITVVDDREEWANRERFPDADEVVATDFSLFLKQYNSGIKDYVLIVTRGHEHDQLILEDVAKKNFGWLGMIGSKRKVGAAFDKLKNIGIQESVIQKIETPVGFDIGAVSPEEIAVSVAARLVQVRRKGLEATSQISILSR